MTDRQAELLAMLARVYLGIGRARHALLLLHPVLSRAGGHVPALRLAAEASVALGRGEAALALCRQLEEAETDPAALRDLGLIRARALMLDGRPEEARRALAAAGAA